MSNAVTNKQIYDVVMPLSTHLAAVSQSVDDIVKRLDKQNGSISSHAEALAVAQADLAILKDKAKINDSMHKTSSNRYWSVGMLLIGIALAILQAFVLNNLSELQASETADHAAAVYAIETPVSTIAPSPFPTSRVEVRTSTPPAYTRSVKATEEDITYLAALCYVEVRGMEENVASACASVIDTVYTRMKVHKFSDGTVSGTLTFDCLPDSVECHFPAYTVNGCRDYSNCPYNNPAQLDLYRSLVSAYLEGKLLPTCSGYIYYGFKPFDTNECTIRSYNGQFINFHN